MQGALTNPEAAPIKNIEATRDFVVNIVDEPLAEAMNQTAANYPSDVDEFRETGLTPVKSDIVGAPMVAESPISLECKVRQIQEFGDAPRITSMVIGEIVQVHIKDGLYSGNEVSLSKLKAIGRLGGNLYCRLTDTFEMERPQIS